MSNPFEPYQQQISLYQQQNLQNTLGTQLFSGGTYYYPTTPTITITQVPVPQETYDAKSAIQIIYRFGTGLVSACLIKGTNSAETAKNVFLGQFTDTPEPEIVAAVAVLLA